jgi:hypothetical protein
LYQFLADAVAVAHLLFIAFVVAGGLFALRWPRIAWLHVPAAAWGAVVEFKGWVCPLTPLENWLRGHGGVPYQGDFVARYLLPVIYPENLTPARQRILGAVVIAANLVIYAAVIRRSRWGRSRYP